MGRVQLHCGGIARKVLNTHVLFISWHVLAKVQSTSSKDI